MSGPLADMSAIPAPRSPAATRRALSMTAGSGPLVDAGMDVASTRLQALLIRQRLGIQALVVAADDSRAVPRLFG